MGTSNWVDVKNAIEAENQRILFDPPEEIVKIFKYAIVESGAGSYDQAFTAMVFTEGDCRYLAFYGANNIVALCDDPALTVDGLKAMARVFLPLSAEFLGYCGLKKLWQFVQDLVAALDTVQTKDEMKELITAVTLYAGTLNSWIQHFFPWNVGTLFPQRKVEDIKEMARLVGV
jgi:hypothetical protein